MRLLRESQIEAYWRSRHPLKADHPIRSHMSLGRFEQIKRFLHISPPSSDLSANYEPTPKEVTQGQFLEKKWWHKLDPMITQSRVANQQYYIPGSKIAIDEVMIKAYGRSLHTFKMPNKPIPQDFKIYALADHGYIFTSTPASRTAFLAEVVKSRDLTMTGLMVLQLVNSLPHSSHGYILYLDNYFTSISLFHLLRVKGVGACGTTRAHSKGFPPLIKVMKERNIRLPWNTMVAVTLTFKEYNIRTRSVFPNRSIGMISAAAFKLWKNNERRRRDKIEIFAASMAASIADIEKALSPKQHGDPGKLLPPQYRQFLDLFNRENADKLPPTAPPR